MGRKIPGRKHRGVKDPEKQQAERFAKIKDKINAPPSHPDDQQIPSSLSRIIDLKNKVKQGLFNKKKKQKKDKTNTIKKISRNPTPKFEQFPGETDREFKHRMNRICSEVIKEAAFEDKYQVDIKRNQDGEVEKVVKRPKDELEQLVKKLKKEQKSKKNYKGKKINQTDTEPKLTKSQKWALKKTAKKNKKQNNKDIDFGFVPQKENFKFGDVVHAPPTLVAPKKVQKIQGAARPGQKELLLKSMLTDDTKIINKTENNNTKKTSFTKVANNLDKKGKRKDMPHALRRQLDKQQKEVIEAYKKLKSKKHTGSSGV
ncbi:unnamed protein product [Ceutorhynchus assimilis]|uniref:Coiled-coil domain-containing protein 137 n=1 Tax=Ceutorhynchus assimilis TaxID=467358 RepID=A0A9N9QSX0_9CUCU|nr:unnamed protein product [Ceutorhynchus assimilis]